MSDDKQNIDIENIEGSEEVLQKEEKTYTEEEYNKIQDSYIRVLAELVNVRRNVDLDKQKGKISIILKIINIIDTYNVVIENHEGEDEHVQILNNILQQLDILIATEGVRRVELKIGENYDPNLAEVVATQENGEDNKILTVLSPAYEMNGNIIKTAKIIVSVTKK
ncbi:MAG: nucleotide exchange factor GrpE [bacterium]